MVIAFFGPSPAYVAFSLINVHVVLMALWPVTENATFTGTNFLPGYKIGLSLFAYLFCLSFSFN